MDKGSPLSLTFKDGSSDAAGGILAAWRVTLERHDKGERAALERLSDPDACLFRPAFHDLRRRLAPLAEITREEDLMALALVAVSTARVKVDREGRFEAGVRLPKALRGREARPLFSELRLQRLLEERDPADLCRQLRRALAQVKGKADPRDVAHWAWGLAHPRLHDRTARAFAYAYYGAEAPGTPPSAPRDVDRVTGETPAIA